MRAAITIGFLLLSVAAFAQDETGTIVFYREPHFAASNSKPPSVFCDGIELAWIQNGSYFEVTAPTGQHECTAESLQRPIIKVSVLAGKAAYVHVELLPGLRQQFGLANTTQNEYDRQKTRLKALKEWRQNTLVPVPPRQVVPAAGVPSDPDAPSETVRTGVTGYPKCISCPAPAYTAEARNARFEGTLILQLTVGTDGRASNVEITTSSGYADLDENAIHVVQTWRFSPALDQNGTPVPVITPIELMFRLR